MERIASKYFIRMQVEDRFGVLASVSSILGNNCISISQMLQKKKTGDSAESVLITDAVEERHIRDAMKVFDEMSIIQSISSLIRVYG